MEYSLLASLLIKQARYVSSAIDLVRHAYLTLLSTCRMLVITVSPDW
jgi:hypothetical protein